MDVTALIPVKGFRNAKQRLGSLLGTAQRELLAEVMFRDVLRQVSCAHGLAAAYVVTGDEQVSDVAKSLGADVIREPVENGETDAVNFARLQLKKSGHPAVLIMPADLPLVRAEDIEHVLSQFSEGAAARFALLVPSRDRMGTNALLLAPPDVIQLRFGYDSFSYHMSQIAAARLPIRIVENERIALDIDEPKDLERFLALEGDEGESGHVARALLAVRREAITR